ncbi:MAG: hypothetical protein O7C60_02285 [Rickettsia endosymbiont of Ixodes persulcatus]|nr:hypothetical protein [Rickettsia endosymbiont of Ixodes persulcatus]
MIQEIPLYIHILFFLAGMLNFSVPFMLETNLHYNELLESFEKVIYELEGQDTWSTTEMLEWINAQYQETYFNVQVIQQNDGFNIELNGVELQQGVDVNSKAMISLMVELEDHIVQMQIVSLLVDLIKGMLYVMFISIALIIAIQYMSRRAIKFKLAFKYITLPVVLGSLVVLGLNVSVLLSPHVIFMMSFVMTSSLFSLLCLNDLKCAMTSDFLGEGRIDYDVY